MKYNEIIRKELDSRGIPFIEIESLMNNYTYICRDMIDIHQDRYDKHWNLGTIREFWNDSISEITDRMLGIEVAVVEKKKKKLTFRRKKKNK